MINTISRLLFILSLMVVGFTSCSDPEESSYGKVTMETTGLFFDENIYTNGVDGDRTRITTFELLNVASLEIDSYPTGWEVELQFYKNQIIVTSPEDISDDSGNDINGEILFSGETFTGSSVSASLSVGIVPFVYIDSDWDMQSNSMIVSEPGKLYIFNSTYKGEDRSQLITGVESCVLLWKETYCSVNHAQRISDTEVGFYLSSDEYDIDEDGDYTDVKEGNAVIAVYDKNDDILWSWHIWAVDGDISEVDFNGVKFMDRNLGASYNDIFTIGYDSYYDAYNTNNSTLNSYGLYYQWGRKDPYPSPMAYNAQGGYEGSIVDDYNTGVDIEYYESTSTVGKVSYATEYPTYYIIGVEESNYDWLYKSHDGDLWTDSQKSIYDPSPKGWRIARSTDFVGVTVSAIPASQTSDGTYSYAAYLKDSYGNEELFIGAGRRNYLSGRIQNVVGDGVYTPWSGYYWTSGSTTDTRSMCLYFSSELTINTQYAARRANGMQIRCVRDE